MSRTGAAEGSPPGPGNRALVTVCVRGNIWDPAQIRVELGWGEQPLQPSSPVRGSGCPVDRAESQ